MSLLARTNPGPRRFALAALSSLLCLSALPADAATAVRLSSERRLSFNSGWRFFKGDAPGAERPAFQDSHWTEVRLPHDWAIEGPFDPKISPHTGSLPISGTGWYRKAFTLPGGAKDRYISIEFDGAMSNAHVWLNGEELGSRPNGYIGFSFDLTPHLRYGNQENVLVVRVTPEERSSRWYPGAGIYRNVWLDVTGPLHVGRWGTYVTTPEVADDKSTVKVRTEVRNRLASEAKITLRTSILDAAGKQVSTTDTDNNIPAGGVQNMVETLTVTAPQRWDIDHPYLYTLVSEVVDENSKVVDRYTTPFGIRSTEFSREKGFLLNGRHLKIQGVCDHSDLGALGMAVNRRATERQLQILKGAGVNAIRTTHNPPSPELLEFADRLGFLVMDEAFDMWRRPKVENDYHKYFDEWSERDLSDMVRRDRNHPSVFMYSIGNEIPEQNSPTGAEIARRLTGLFHREDPTRPTTSAFDKPDLAIRNKLADEVDIPGINYKPTQYEGLLKDHPNWIIYGAETSSCVSSRGVYHLPIEKYEKHPSLQISSYDIIAPPWAYCPDIEFEVQDKFPNLLGEFVWTGFDYIGEPTPFFNDKAANATDWPARSSYFGMVDLAGFPKDRYYLYQSVWTKSPMVHVLPHWNWEGREGQMIPVMVYSNASEIELFLNGTSLGRKKRFSEPVELPVGPNVSQNRKFLSKYRLMWQVPYQPGALKAVAYQDGRQVAVDEVRTAGAPARIKLVPDRATIQADGEDLSFVTVRIEDKDGNLCPLADNDVRFNVTGAGSLRAVDNGNAATAELFNADHRKAFNGLALVIVKSQQGQSGKIQVGASSPGLGQVATDLTAQRPNRAPASY